MTPVVDPLDGLERHRLDTQVGILANEVRNQRNQLDVLGERLNAVQAAIWGVCAALLVAMVGIIVTLVATRPG